MDHFRMNANKCEYKDKDRRLEEQFINGINDDDMMTEIIWEWTTVKKTCEITRKQSQEEGSAENKKTLIEAIKRQGQVWCHENAWTKELINLPE